VETYQTSQVLAEGPGQCQRCKWLVTRVLIGNAGGIGRQWREVHWDARGKQFYAHVCPNHDAKR
jgi:hypothetical protein